MVARTNYSSGYVVEYNDVCFDSWLLLPAGNLWPKWLRGFLYSLAMMYIFVGIAIAADMFMLSIEMITSKKRIIFTFDYKSKQRVEQEVFVWNETVANLTLMALGSSAPEILIAVVETVSTLDDTKSSDGLGVFTIIGSASYNLLVITAVCIMAVPSQTTKRVVEFGVFLVTSIWSMFAYVWLIIVLQWSSPNQIDIWEAVLTLMFFPLLVLTAWGQDKGWWCNRLKNKKHVFSVHCHVNSEDGTHHSPFPHIVDVHPAHRTEGKAVIVDTPVVASPRRRLSDLKLKQLTDSRSKIRDIVSYVRETDPEEKISAKDLVQGLRQHFDCTMSRAFARARFRHAVVLSITGGQKNVFTNPKHNEIISNAVKGNSNTFLQLSNIAAMKSGSFCFSSSSYSVSRKSTSVQIDVLFNRRKRVSKVGFSHVVDAAQKASKFCKGSFRSNNNNNCIHHRDTYDTLVHSDSNKNNDMYTISHSSPDQSSLPEVSGHGDSDISQEYKNDSTTVEKSKKKGYGSRRESDLHVTTPRHISISQLSRHLSLEELNNTTSNQGNAMLGVCIVRYETREGQAKAKKDFVPMSGNLIFSEQEYSKHISIPIMCNDEHSDVSKDLYVVLKDACGNTFLSEPSVAHITILNDNEPGEFIFQEPTYHVQYSAQNTATATAKVVRLHGSDGNIDVFYRTINGTALGGDIEDMENQKCDFQHIEQGVLNFVSGETSKKITVNIQPTAEAGRTFIIALYHVTGSGKIGHRCAAIISLTSEVDEIVDQVTSLVSKERENISVKEEWKQQIVDAMFLDGTPSSGAMVLHFLCFLWKVLFAFIPPRTVWGGWAAFIVSLLLLGVLSAFVEQFAKLLGCVIGLHVSITGITLVALGTSMPDTFASKTAALQDDSADAAIGNITGSNSVNVFLGLGLPWVLKSIYLNSKGSKLILNDDNLLFSAVVFLSCGTIALVVLVIRRIFCKGELGGGTYSRYVSSCILVSLWLLFVTFCSLKAYGVISGF